jgi:ribosomal protein S18 acetylase RimI-like enzyme
VSLCIIPIQAQDSPALLELARSVDEAHVYPTLLAAGRDILAQHRQQDIERLFVNEFYQTLKAVLHDQIVGYIAWRDGHYISHLYVANHFQHRGIGTQLLDAMRQRATQFPLQLKSSLNAVGFYQRYGFYTTADEQDIKGIRFVPMEFRPWPSR